MFPGITNQIPCFTLYCCVAGLLKGIIEIENMKKFLITISGILCVFFAFSQDNRNPPETVRKSFQNEYPRSKPGQWSQSGGSWNVSFNDKDHNNGEVTAHFDGNGSHTDTYVPYNRKDVPAPVMDNVKSKYSGSGSSQFTRIDRSGGNSVYQVNLKSKKEQKTVYMDEKGQETNYHGGH
jgi:hypothetical protein